MEFSNVNCLFENLKEQNKVLGVHCVTGAAKNEVVVTTTDQVLIVEVDGKGQGVCRKNWYYRMNSEQALSVPAVKFHKSDQYYGVVGLEKKTLITWKHDDKDFYDNKSDSRFLVGNHMIYKLFTHSLLGNVVLAVYPNTGFSVYDAALKFLHHARPIVKNEKLQWCDLVALPSFESPKSPAILFLAMLRCNQQKEYSMDLVSINLIEKTVATSVVATHVFKSGDAHAVPLSCHFDVKSNALLILWSNGHWEVVQFERKGDVVFDEKSHSQGMQSLDFVREQAWNVDESSNKRKKMKKEKAVELAIVHSATVNQQIALCSIQPSGNIVMCQSMPKKLSKTLTGWDRRFGTFMTSRNLSDEESSTKLGDRSFGDVVMISFQRDFLFVAYEQVVFSVRVESRETTLSSILAQPRNDSFRVGLSSDSPPMSVPQTLNVDALVAAFQDGWVDEALWKEKIQCTSSHNEEACMQDLLNLASKAPGDNVAFINRLCDFLEEASSGSKHKHRSDAVCLSVLEDGMKYMSQRLFTFVMNRCIETSSMNDSLTWKIVQLFIRSQRVSARAFPKLIPTLIQNEQLAALEVAMQTLPDIPEISYVQLLRFMIGSKVNTERLIQYHREQANTKKTETKRTKKELKQQSQQQQSQAQSQLAHKSNPHVELVNALSRFIHPILAQSMNDVFLQKALAKLSLDEVLVMLTLLKRYLFNLFEETKRASKVDDESLDTLNEKLMPQPSIAHVYDWISMLMDSHFVQLVVHSTENACILQLLRELEQVIRKHRKLCTRMARMHGELQHFISGTAKSYHPIPPYSVEVLHL